MRRDPRGARALAVLGPLLLVLLSWPGAPARAATTATTTSPAALAPQQDADPATGSSDVEPAPPPQHASDSTTSPQDATDPPGDAPAAEPAAPPQDASDAPATEPDPAALAQDAATGDAAAATGSAVIGPADATSWTVSELESRLGSVAETPGLSDAQRTQAAAALQAAIAQLRAAEDWAAQAAAFEDARIGAPARLAEIQAQLAQPAPPVVRDLPPDTSLSDLEQRLAQAQSTLATAKKEAADLELERSRRADRRVAVPKELADARRRLDELKPAPAANAEVSPVVAEAERARVWGTRVALEKQIGALEQELTSYDARGELLTRRQDLAARAVSSAQAAADLWQREVVAKREAEARQAELDAARALEEAARSHEVVRRVADHNAFLTARTNEINGLLEARREQLAQLQTAVQVTTQRHDGVIERVQRGGFTHAVAVLLREHRDALPPLSQLRRTLADLQLELSNIGIETFDYEQERVELRQLDDVVAEALEDVESNVSERRRAAIERELRRHYESQRGYLDTIIDRGTAYADLLRETEAAQIQRIDATAGYAQYIDEHVLWVRSTDILGPHDVVELGRAVLWLLQPDAWLALAGRIGAGLSDRPSIGARLLLAVLALGLLPWSRRTVLDASRSLQDARLSTQRFTTTILVFSATLLGAAAVPVALWAVAGFLASVPGTPPLASALASGLDALAFVAIPLSLIGHAARPRGLCEVHLRWSPAATRSIRAQLWLPRAIALPAVLVAGTLDGHATPEANASLGRLALITALVVFGIFLHGLLRPSGPFALDVETRARSGWFSRTRGLWFFLVRITPFVLAIAIVLGFQYMGREIGERLVASGTLLVVLTLGRGVVLRGLYLARVRLRIEQARRRREAQVEKDSADIAPGELEALGELEHAVDLEVVDAQSRGLIRLATTITVLVGLWLIWVDVFPALGVLDRVGLWETRHTEIVEGEERIAHDVTTLSELLGALVLVALTIAAARNIPGLLDIALLQRVTLEPGAGYAIKAITSYVIVVVGVVLGIGLLGIAWSDVQWLVAAVTVGLGFGLQEIFANFVSGLIILFERPVRVGDVVTVGGTDGMISRIRIRATTITDWDRRELLIPNRRFITDDLINWTLSDPVTREVFSVGVAYGSDTRLTTQTLLDVARRHALVLAEPGPSVVFRRFDDSALLFQLRVFIAKRDHWPQLTHELNIAIDDALRAAGIEIAFPQRDLHVRSFDAPIHVRSRGDGPARGDGGDDRGAGPAPASGDVGSSR